MENVKSHQEKMRALRALQTNLEEAVEAKATASKEFEERSARLEQIVREKDHNYQVLEKKLKELMFQEKQKYLIDFEAYQNKVDL